MRRLYVKSHGRSQTIWSLLFRALRRHGRDLGDDRLRLAERVMNDGYAVEPGFLDPLATSRLAAAILDLPGAERTPVRIDYEPNDLLTIPAISDLLIDERVLAAAAAYLRAQPILAGLAAWQSLAHPEATDADLSTAAQLFHFDCDWPRFIKFFIYLTDVTDDDGPFAIVEGTHRAKPIWRDGRIDERELLDDHGLRHRERRISGTAGTLIAADTSAFHRGSPVVAGPRLVLELEFAVSRLGASQQYTLLPASARPEGGGTHTFDYFAAPP
jgi:hypothetical protein